MSKLKDIASICPLQWDFYFGLKSGSGAPSFNPAINGGVKRWRLVLALAMTGGPEKAAVQFTTAYTGFIENETALPLGGASAALAATVECMQVFDNGLNAPEVQSLCRNIISRVIIAPSGQSFLFGTVPVSATEGLPRWGNGGDVRSGCYKAIAPMTHGNNVAQFHEKMCLSGSMSPGRRAVQLWGKEGHKSFFEKLLLWKSCLVLFLAFLLSSCNSGKDSKQTTEPLIKKSSLPIKYAKGFTVDYYDGFKLLSVRDVNDTTRILARYILLSKGTTAPVAFKKATPLYTPVRKVVCISTTHMAEMVKLGLTKNIAGVTNIAYIYDSTITAKVKNNDIANLGNDEVNFEKLVELNPSFVFTSGGYDGGDKLKFKLDALKVNSVVDIDYKEQDPLARAEWLKFIAAFYDKEQLADSIFNGIEKNYLTLKEKAKNVTGKPSIFFNMPFKEIWYMPSGETYMAKLVDDAGGDFLWKGTKATNGLNLNLDYEAVYNKAANADFWINTGFANSLEEIKGADIKNTFFKAYKTGQVYNNNKRNTPGGGFDFWESGVVNPDKILADLIFIFHPELLPGHELYYYQKLKQE